MPPVVVPSVAPAGFPVCAVHAPVVGFVPVKVAEVPAQVD